MQSIYESFPMIIEMAFGNAILVFLKRHATFFLLDWMRRALSQVLSNKEINNSKQTGLERFKDGFLNSYSIIDASKWLFTKTEIPLKCNNSFTHAQLETQYLRNKHCAYIAIFKRVAKLTNHLSGKSFSLLLPTISVRHIRIMQQLLLTQGKH